MARSGPQSILENGHHQGGPNQMYSFSLALVPPEFLRMLAQRDVLLMTMHNWLPSSRAAPVPEPQSPNVCANPSADIDAPCSSPVSRVRPWRR
jgi:hypothetical protein